MLAGNYERQPNEDTPIRLILCADKSDEQIELLQSDKSGIRVASYMTELLLRQMLQKKLHDAITLARARLQKNYQSSSPDQTVIALK